MIYLTNKIGKFLPRNFSSSEKNTLSPNYFFLTTSDPRHPGDETLSVSF